MALSYNKQLILDSQTGQFHFGIISKIKIILKYLVGTYSIMV